MAFSAGTDAIVLLNGYDLTDFLRSAGTSGSRDMLDATHLRDNDRRFIGGLRNFVFNSEGMYDGTLDAVDQALSEAMEHGAATILTYLPSGDGFGRRGKGMDGDESSYDINAPVDGIVSIAANVQSSVGNEPIRVLAPLAARDTTANGTALDNTAGTNNGCAGYLQVMGVDATLDVTIEHSDDGVGWDTLITFDQFSDRGAQRISVGGEVKRHVRATWNPAANPATFHVAFYRA